MGAIWLIVTSGVVSLARTRSPTCTPSEPVRPAIGATMSVYNRLTRAVSMAALSASTVAFSAATLARRLSY